MLLLLSIFLLPFQIAQSALPIQLIKSVLNPENFYEFSTLSEALSTLLTLTPSATPAMFTLVLSYSADPYVLDKKYELTMGAATLIMVSQQAAPTVSLSQAGELKITTYGNIVFQNLKFDVTKSQVSMPFKLSPSASLSFENLEIFGSQLSDSFPTSLFQIQGAVGAQFLNITIAYIFSGVLNVEGIGQLKFIGLNCKYINSAKSPIIRIADYGLLGIYYVSVYDSKLIMNPFLQLEFNVVPQAGTELQDFIISRNVISQQGAIISAMATAFSLQNVGLKLVSIIFKENKEMESANQNLISIKATAATNLSMALINICMSKNVFPNSFLVNVLSGIMTGIMFTNSYIEQNYYQEAFHINTCYGLQIDSVSVTLNNHYLFYFNPTSSNFLRVENANMASVNIFVLYGCAGFMNLPGISMKFLDMPETVLLVNNSRFLENFAKLPNDYYGCSIHLKNVFKAVLQFTNFTYNYISQDLIAVGGTALIMESISGNLIVGGCFLVKNKATKGAALFEFEGYSLTVIMCYFEGNGPDNYTFKSTNGIMKAELTELSVQGAYFLYNIADKGNIYVIERSYLKVSLLDSFFVGNIGTDGTVLFIDERTLNSTVSLINNIYKSNYNYRYGAVFFIFSVMQIHSQTLLVKDTIIIDNTGEDDLLFCIWIYSGETNNTFINTTFVNNTYPLQKTSAPLFTTDAIEKAINLNFYYCIFYNNHNYLGNIFFATKTKISLYYTQILNNTVSYTYAIFFLEEHSDVKYVNCLIMGFGGGLAGLGGGRASKVGFINTAIDLGLSYYSFIELIEGSEIYFDNATISNLSSAMPTGVVIKLSNCKTNTTIINSKFSLLDSPIFSLDSSNLNVFNLSITSFKRKIFELNSATVNIVGLSVTQGQCADRLNDLACIFISYYSTITIQSSLIGYLMAAQEKVLFTMENTVLAISQTQMMGILVMDGASNPQIMFAESCDITITYSLAAELFAPFITAKFSNISYFGSKFLQTSQLFKIKKSSHQLVSSDSVSIIGCLFANFTLIDTGSGLSGAAVSVSKLLRQDRMFTFMGNMFALNRAIDLECGALELDEVHFNLTGNLFTFNSAKRGGALCFRSESINFKASIIGNNFTYNYANISGGALWWYYSAPVFIQNQYSNNSAGLYGQDVFSFPVKLLVTIEINGTVLNNSLNSTFDKSTFFLSGINSSLKIPQEIYMRIADTYDQVITDTSSEEVAAGLKESSSAENRREIFGKLSTISSTNLSQFVFDSLFITAKPSSSVNLVFTSPFIKTFGLDYYNHITKKKANEFIDENGYTLVIPVFMRSCGVGEIYKHSDEICELCKPGYYSLTENATECKACMKEADCKGGDQVLIKAGFWRESRVSEDIYECNEALKSCLGGIDSECSEDYEGIKCEECNNEGGKLLQKSFSGTCLECPNPGLIVVVYLLVDAVLCLVIYMMACYMRNPEKKLTNKILLKILINHFHFFLIIQSYNIQIPLYFSRYLNIQNTFSQVGQFWFSLECVIKEVTPHYSIHIEVVLVTLILLLSIFFSYVFKFVPYFKKFGTTLKVKHILLLVFYILQPNTIDYLYSKSTCVEIMNKWVLRKHNSYNCYDEGYWLWFFLFYLPGLLLFGIIIPVFIFRKMLHKLGKQNQKVYDKKTVQRVKPSTLRSNLWLLGSTKNNYIDYEIVHYFLKTGLILINQSNMDNQIKHLIVNWSLILYIVSVDPIIYKKKNKLYHLLDFGSKIGLIAVSYLLLWMAMEDISSAAQAFLFIIIVGCQGVFLWLILVVFLHERFSWLPGVRLIEYALKDPDPLSPEPVKMLN